VNRGRVKFELVIWSYRSAYMFIGQLWALLRPTPTVPGFLGSIIGQCCLQNNFAYLERLSVLISKQDSISMAATKSASARHYPGGNIALSCSLTS